MKKQLATLAALFFFAHLFFLPPTLEDIDSINFALGVRDFDVAAHRPHPPGYPVFIALGKASTALFRAAGAPSAAPQGLAFWSAASGALLVLLLFAFYRGLGGESLVAWWAMAIAISSPLMWFTALRPLSDVSGLAVAVAAQAALVRAWHGASQRPGRFLIAGAALAGFAAGLRVQTVMLTAPPLLLVLVFPRRLPSLRDRLVAVAAGIAGVAVWAVPLLVASGGLSEYLAALGRQAGEDLSGVVMLWTTREPRVAVDAALYTFVWPWGTFVVGVVMLVVAALGLARVAWRAPGTAALLLVCFAPYAVFHLLFHETLTIRYALPLVLPAAYLVAYACAAAGPIGLTISATSIVLASLAMALPAARLYARDGSPALRLYHDHVPRHAESAASPRPVVSFHAVMWRVEEWERDHHAVRAVRRPHGREWLGLIDHWRTQPDAPLFFVADPRRTDLALFDPHARELLASERWSFPEIPFVAGTRPGAADLYRMRPPGWMLDRGWAVTAEVGGVTARDGSGPHIRPSIAWVRARADPASLIVGGRNLSPEGGPAAILSVARDGVPLDTWEVRPGFFFRHVPLPAGALEGAGYLPLRIAAASGTGSGPVPAVSLEQFDVQSAGHVMLGYLEGWYEPEYNPATGRSWRWMSEQARIWVRPVGRDVTLTLSGESPGRYFDRAPLLKVLVGGVEMGQFRPSSDFTQPIRLPARQLDLAGGIVVIESDLWFTPSERGQSADERRLAMRIYSAQVK